MTWDGKERRKGMFDKDFYDKMMETHLNVKKMVEWSDTHDTKDDERFRDINKKLLWGFVALVIIASATGVLAQVVGVFTKVGG